MKNYGRKHLSVEWSIGSVWYCVGIVLAVEQRMLESFLLEYFPRLPNHVILEVLSLLPGEYITEVMMKLDNDAISNVILEEYFGREMHVMLSPTHFPHACQYPQHISELIDFDSFGEIDEFLTDFPNINPRRLVIITGGDFRSLEHLLTNYRERFVQMTCEIDLHIERYELDDKDLALIASFPNLRKLQFSRASMTKALGSLGKCLSKLQNLEELVFLGHKIIDWSTIKLPPNLKHIDISWYEHLNINTITLPGSITGVFWNRSGLDSDKLVRQVFPANLTTLMLTYNNLSSIDVSKLPPNLETVDLLYNSINEFTASSSDKSWPPMLRSILLSHNDIKNEGLALLSELDWPLNLQNLKLDNNRFTSLVDLKYLPDKLEYLDLSNTPLTSLEVLPYDSLRDDYPFYQFPPYLDVLHLSNCWRLDFSNYQSTKRITFPPALTGLNLDECNITDLKVFEFPKSLKNLSLSGNKIENLVSYNFSIDEGFNGPKQMINWKQLVNLVDLELYLNKIATLDDWEIPPNLRNLDIRLNFLSHLSSRSPLFSAHYSQATKNLQVLKLSDNNIKTVDIDVAVPHSLKTLLLDRNHLVDEFVFPTSFVNNDNLEELGLSMCGLARISFTSNCTTASQLKKLDLTDNYLLYEVSDMRDAVNEFYDTLEAGLGAKVSKRKFRVNSVHTFTTV